MKKYELKGYLESEIAASYSGLTGDLADDIGQSLDYYLGKPFGNEIDGKSQVVSDRKSVV